MASPLPAAAMLSTRCWCRSVPVPDHQRLAAHLPEWRTATEIAAWFEANNVPSRRVSTAASSSLSARRTRPQPRRIRHAAGAGRPGMDPRACRAARGSAGPRRRCALPCQGEDDVLHCRPRLDRRRTRVGRAAQRRPAGTGGWSAIESLLSHPADTAEGRPGPRHRRGPVGGDRHLLVATLRTAAPLVGAGLDRIVHAKLIAQVTPPELAARAANSLELVGDDIGPSVVTMLE
jgi:hypothetical protein